MKLLIVAGGGGHFAPALAVIEALPKNWEVMVIGRKYAFEADKTESFESQTAQKLGIPFIPLTTGRLQRKLSRHSLVSLAKVPVGYVQALKIVKNYKPDVLLSFGGYVAVPVALAAKTLGVPIVVHEQILGAGLANKLVASFADKVCISWEQSKAFFPAGKVVLTGNPVKTFSIANFPFTIANEKLPLIYITGGSGGAHGINVLIEGCLEKLLEKYVVIHQTGAAVEYGDFDRLEKKKSELPGQLQKRYFPSKFLDAPDVFAVIEKADLVVSRSGINTVTELLSCGKPSLFIPLPHGQQNEQLTNALFVKQIGIAEVIDQKTATPETVFAAIEKMIAKIESYQQYKKAAQQLIVPDAAQKILTVIDHGNQQTQTTKS